MSSGTEDVLKYRQSETQSGGSISGVILPYLNTRPDTMCGMRRGRGALYQMGKE